MKKSTALLLAALLLLSGCARKAAGWERFSRTYYDAFDTVITLTCLAENETEFKEAAEAFEAELFRLDAIFDLYEAHEGTAGLWALNHAEGEWLKVEPELYDLLAQCLSWRSVSDRVNVAMGGVLALWHDFREEGKALPPTEALELAAEHADPDRIELDPEGRRVRLNDAALRLDLGAVAKGWSVERLAELLEARKVDFLIDAGGNVRAGSRAHDGKDAWRIGVTDPQDPEGLICVLALAEMSAVTSGGYQRYYEVDGVRYHHLIDPDTLMPANFVLQTTILTRDAALADFLSTAAFLLPYAESRALIEGLEGVEAVWVLNDGSLEMTDGARAFVEQK